MMPSYKFRTAIGETIYNQKYSHDGEYSWPELSKQLVSEVCDGLMSKDEVRELTEYVTQMKFIPGVRRTAPESVQQLLLAERGGGYAGGVGQSAQESVRLFDEWWWNRCRLLRVS
jgi:hypothetical protein